MRYALTMLAIGLSLLPQLPAKPETEAAPTMAQILERTTPPVRGAATPDGRVHLIWTDGTAVFTTSGTTEGPWSEPLRLDTEGDPAPMGGPHGPRIGAGADGTVAAVWSAGRATIRCRTFREGIWREAVRVDAGDTAVRWGQSVAVGVDGRVVACWLEGNPSERMDLLAARSGDGGAVFANPVTLDRDACVCCPTGIVLDADGTTTVAYRENDGGWKDIGVVRWPGDAEPRERSIVHEDGWNFAGCPDDGPSIGLDADGALHLAWYTQPEGSARVRFAASRDGGTTFDPPSEATTTGGEAHRSPVLGTGSDGTVWIAWTVARRGGPSVVRAGRVGPEDPPLLHNEVLTPEGRPAVVGESPDLVPLPDGRMLLLWSEPTPHGPRCRGRVLPIG